MPPAGREGSWQMTQGCKPLNPRGLGEGGRASGLGAKGPILGIGHPG